MELAKNISTLLYEHDCVIVPGFGGFVCSYHPAEIHPGQHAFHPPSKKILFNSALQANDGLLVSHVAIKHGISFDEALKMITEEVNELAFDIKSGKRVTLDAVGILYADPDGNIQFDQDRTKNYLSDAYGLATFVSPPVHRQLRKSIRKQPTAPPDRRPEKQASPMLKKAAYWSTGIAATFLLLGLILLNFNRVNDLMQSETSFLPSIGKSSAKTEIIKPAETTDVTHQQQIVFFEKSDNELNYLAEKSDIEATGINGKDGDDDTAIYADLSAELELPAAFAEAPAPEAPAVISNQRMYHLIAGSFERVDNAEVLIEKYTGHGYQPAIIGQAANGYYRVSIAAYIRKDEALTELEKARTAFNPNIWLLRQ